MELNKSTFFFVFIPDDEKSTNHIIKMLNNIGKKEKLCYFIFFGLTLAHIIPNFQKQMCKAFKNFSLKIKNQNHF
jgi:hypothetical protein